MRKGLRRLARGVCFLGLSAFLALVVLSFVLNGPRLARFVTHSFINPNIRGRVEVRAIEWKLSGLLLGLGEVPVVASGVRVFDEHGKLVLDAPRARGSFHLARLLFGGRGDIHVDNLVIEPDREKRPWCLVEQIEIAPERREVGLLAAFRSKKKTAEPDFGRPGPIYLLDGIVLKDVDLTLDFVSWKAVLKGAQANGGWLRSSSRDPRETEFTFALDEVLAPRATLDIGGRAAPNRLHFGLAEVRSSVFAIMPEAPETMLYDLTAVAEGDARVRARGELRDLYGVGGVDLSLDVKNGGELVGRLSRGHLHGDHLSLATTLTGRYDEDLEVFAQGGGLRATRFPLEVEQFRASLRTGEGKGGIQELVIRPQSGAGTKGGVARITGQFNLSKSTFGLLVDMPQPIDISPLVPPQAAKYVDSVGGAELWGQVAVRGSSRHFKIKPLKPVALHLGDARISGAIYVDDLSVVNVPKKLKVKIKNDWLRVDSGRAALDRDGKLALDRIRFHVVDLAKWLRVFGVLGVGGSARAWQSAGASGEGRVTGTYKNPTVSGRLVGTNLGLVDRAEALIRYASNSLAFRSLSASVLGGELGGQGEIIVRGSAESSLAKRIVIKDLRLVGDRFDLARIPDYGRYLAGTGRLEVTAQGPLGGLSANATANVTDASFQGIPLGDGNAKISWFKDVATVLELSLDGPIGGPLTVKGRIAANGQLELELNLDHLFLSRLPWIRDRRDLGLDGYLQLGAIRIGGTWLRPRLLGGHVYLSEVAFRDTLLGGGQLELTQWPGGGHFDGKLFQTKLCAHGDLSFPRPLGAVLVVELRRVELEEFLPEIADKLGAHAWVSGVAEMHWTMGEPLLVKLTLPEVMVSFDARDPLGRELPLIFRNGGVVEVVYRDGVTRLTKTVDLVGKGNERLALSGSYQRARDDAPPIVDLEVDGNADLKLLEFFTSRYFDEAQGRAEVSLRLKGALPGLVPKGTLNLHDVSLRLKGQETEIRLPRGMVSLHGAKVDVTDVAMEIDGVRSKLTGAVVLSPSDFKLDALDLSLQGRVAAKLLEVIPKTALHVSQTAGSAAVDILIQGTLERPDIDGILIFDSPFEVSSRALRRDFVFSSGMVRFASKAEASAQEIALSDVEGTVAGERLRFAGDPENCEGEFCLALKLQDWSFAGVYLVLRLDSLRHGVPSVLEVEVAADDLVLSGNAEELSLVGTIRLIDGRYVRGFDIVRDVIEPHRTQEDAPPFWTGRPLWENLHLDLLVKTSGTFQVDNNLAELDLVGEVNLAGTPAKPSYDGEIYVIAGKINLHAIGIRPSFELSEGTSTVSFDPGKEFPLETPTLDLNFEADFEDRSAQRHLVYLRLSNPLGALKWDLHTNSGLSNAQTLALITTGEANADEFVRGNGPPGTPSSDSSTQMAGSSSGFYSTVDTLSKEYAGTFVSNLFEEQFKKIFRVDCFRIEPGPESVKLSVCKNLANKRFRLDGELDQGYRADYRFKSGLNFQLDDEWSIDGYYLRDAPASSDESQELEQRLRLQGRLRYVIP